MPHASSDHLDRQTLRAYANGELENSAHNLAERHILTCDACCQMLRDVEVTISVGFPTALRTPRESDRPWEDRAALASGTPRPSLTGHGRFLPGQVIASRYRIVSLLASGGMGEVYRADDLRLEQPVALKFLGDAFSGRPRALEQLHAEVKLARRISHPHVCRVFDIGTADGQPFLTMEYIDGEDLKSLLSRIGKLPRSKAIQLSRQLCLGLQAAHQQGTLHRDLKPANIMIDGRGILHITDFGLATLGEPSDHEIAGTPAYMAPEQLSDRTTSLQSDIYALGLVLAEMFVGHPIIPSGSLDEIIAFHDKGEPSLSHDLPPDIEHAVRQCLQPRPSERAISVADVLEQIPQVDLLSHTLASGETPTPELLLSHSPSGPISNSAAGLWLGSLVLGVFLLLCVPIGKLPGMQHTVDFPLPPSVLAYKARETILATGYFADAVPNWPSEAHGFLPNFQATGTGADAAYHYWYRLHQEPMVAQRRLATRVSYDDPPPLWPGMLLLRTDLHGRLIELHAAPQPTRPQTKHPFDFADFFSSDRLGIDFSTFEPFTAEWTPKTAFDNVFSWKQRSVPAAQSTQIFAATYRGSLVAFQLVRSGRSVNATAPGAPIADVTRVAIVLLLVLGIVLASFNMRHARCDRLGASRLAWAAALLTLFAWLMQSTFTGFIALDARTVLAGLQSAVFIGAIMWCFYSALEPFVRRFWPATLVTWTRVLRGQIHDRAVGRDVLVGLSSGVLCHVLMKLWCFAGERAGLTMRPSLGIAPEVLLGMRESLGGLTNCLLFALTESLFLLMFLFAIRLPLRTKGIATVLFVMFFAMLFTLTSPEYVVIYLTIWTATAILLTRFGLVALICFQFVRHVVEGFPMPADLTRWYAGFALIPIALTIALGVFAYLRAITPQRRGTLG